MSKVDHHSLEYKQNAKPNKSYKELKMKQKQLISDLMFRFVYEYFLDCGKLPEEDSYDVLAQKVYDRLKSRSIWIPYDELYNKGFLKKIDRAKERVENGDIYIKSEKKAVSDKPSKPANPKRICPNCGRRMKQHFIGLKHCSCGTSWMKGTGYFERTPDMVFCLKRVHKGKKVKQVPCIRYKPSNREFDDMIFDEQDCL